jgi:putative DNA methylase
LVSTDPPYYDNIGYAALSDFFYVWLRRTIGDLYPDLFSTVLVPKSQELTASPERFDGDKQRAKEHFETGFRKAFAALREKMNPEFPLTVYYAFKQDDEESGGDEESEGNFNNGKVDLTTGWETMLEALVGTGFQITATWPVRASQAWRMRAMGSNALASYIVLACRPRPENAPQTDRRSFVAGLNRELPAALRHLQQGNVAPVDFAQAAIGPGMAIYSRYSRILEASGRPMSVRTALALINQTLTEVLSEQEDEFDSDTRWAIAWYEQHGFEEGEFGDAELLSKAKVTSVAGLVQSGIVHSRAGKVRLLRPEELPKDWDPASDKRLTNWELTHHLLRVYYHEKAGEIATAELLRKIGAQGELARDLAYRLFDLSERKNRSQEAQAYNALVLGWPEIARLARAKSEEQGALFEG